MKIGILQTGHAPDEMRPRHGDYDTLFHALLGGNGFEFETYNVVDGEFPNAPQDADGWLITGSKHGVYEEHAFIPPLEDFIRRAYADAVPIVGICFGHQIVAQALGGKVEKFEGGWSVGTTTYRTKDGEELSLMAWHQDQVVEPPAEAEVEASSDFCRYAILRYGDRALTIQPHPEFTPDFSGSLIEARGDILPFDIAERAAESLAAPLDTAKVAERIAGFLSGSAQAAKERSAGSS
jgi:GMP synthase (glutamine-hydrolysing)